MYAIHALRTLFIKKLLILVILKVVKKTVSKISKPQSRRFSGVFNKVEKFFFIKVIQKLII